MTEDSPVRPQAISAPRAMRGWDGSSTGGFCSPELDLGRPASEGASPEAIGVAVRCWSQLLASSVPVARRVLYIFTHYRELQQAHDKNKTLYFGRVLKQRSPFMCLAVSRSEKLPQRVLCCSEPREDPLLSPLLQAQGSPRSLQRCLQPTSPLAWLRAWSPPNISSCDVLFPGELKCRSLHSAPAH